MKTKLFGIAFLLAVLFPSCNNTGNESVSDNPPNILFAISDDQSYLHTGFAGCKFVNTPAFDRVAAEGIYFTNCYAGSPGCAPSRSAIVTGRYHWQNEQSGQHGSSWMKKYVPFVDMLDSAGYYTGRTGKGVSPFRYARDESDSLWRFGDAAGKTHSNISFIDPADEIKHAKGIVELNYFENFKYFMDHREGDQPFFFWYGGIEPHRDYEQDSWKRNGKKLSDVTVPGYLPDNDVIRGDLLDYAVEIDWFDLHLKKMIDYLEEIGELDNTIIIVTGDNGMPFPRAKAFGFDHGIHVPLAIRYPKSFPGNRVVEDLISFSDFAPTILELTGASGEGMLPMSGKSFENILKSKKSGIIDKDKNYVFSGRERHSSSRYKNWGYPVRAIRSRDYLLLYNIKPDRWPAGAPQRIDPKNPDKLLPMFGLTEEGKHNPAWAYTDIDPSPSKSYIIEHKKEKDIMPLFEMTFEKFPEFQLFNLKKDPDCLHNLAGNPDYSEVESRLKKRLMEELRASKDPRIVGPDKEVFDSYKRYMGIRDFPKPD